MASLSEISAQLVAGNTSFNYCDNRVVTEVGFAMSSPCPCNAMFLVQKCVGEYYFIRFVNDVAAVVRILMNKCPADGNITMNGDLFCNSECRCEVVNDHCVNCCDMPN